MSPVKGKYYKNIGARRSASMLHRGRPYLKQHDHEKIESGIESGPDSPIPVQNVFGLTHAKDCGCPAADLQAIVIVKLEHENHRLRTRLEKTEKTMSQMLRQMELQKTRTRQLIAGWKLKIQEGEDKMAAYSKEKDDQLANLLSQLMYFEGCLKKERKDIMEEIKVKTSKINDLEKTVKHQKRQIDALNRANERLLTSLHDTMNRKNGHDLSDESEESSSCNSSSEEQSSDESHDSVSSEKNESSHVIRVRRKASMPALSYTNGNLTSNISKYRPAIRRRNTSHVTNGRPVPIILTPTPELPIPESSRRRVHFDTRVQNGADNKEERYSSDDSVTKSTGRLRKISLPAYRLPSDEEGSIRYF